MVKAKISPIVLRHARISIKKSLSEASISLGLDEEVLSNLETSDGQVEVTYPQLKNFSRVYKRPLAFFLLTNIPTNLEPENDFRTLESVQIADFDTQMSLVLREAQSTRRKYLKLLEDLEIEYDLSLPTLNAKQDVAAQAAQLREAVGVTVRQQLKWVNSEQREARNRWVAAIEEKGVLVLSHSFNVEEIRGFALSGNNLPPAVIYNSGDDVRASIFTIIHELAHVLVENGDAYEHRTIEKFCNAVAGNFLVPEDALRRHPYYEKLLVSIAVMDDSTRTFDYWISRLSSEFIVSRQVILRRVHALNAISQPVYESKKLEYTIDYGEVVKKKEEVIKKRKEAGKRGGGESVHSRVVRNYGSTYTRTVLDAVNSAKISAYEASEYFGRIKAKHLGAIEQTFSKRYE